MNTRSRHGALPALALLALAAGAQTSVTYNWTNTAGGAFADAGSWSPSGGPPTAWALNTVNGGDIIEFNRSRAEPYTVTVAAGDTFGIAYVRTDRVRLDLGGNTLLSGRIGNGSVFVGSGSGHVGTLIVTNGTWNPSLHWQIGHSGGIGLLVNDGAWLKPGDINISNAGKGTYIVRNGGQHTGVNSLNIGSSTGSANGTLIVTNAGSYVEVNGCHVKNGSRAIVGPGAQLKCSRSLAVYDTSRLRIDGTLGLTKAAYFGTMQANLDLDGGVLEGSGMCTNTHATPTVSRFTTRNNGTIHPGGTNAAGCLTIGPTVYTQTVGKVVFEIGGAEAGQYDRLTILGSVSLNPAGATCEVVFLGDYLPAGGEAYNLFAYDALVGSFFQLALPDIGRQLAWDTEEWYDAGILRVAIVPPKGTCIMVQ
jgi:hypothetical protein